MMSAGCAGVSARRPPRGAVLRRVALCRLAAVARGQLALEADRRRGYARSLVGECDSRRDPLVPLQSAHGLDSCYHLAGLLRALAVSPGADSRHNPAALAIGLADAGFGHRWDTRLLSNPGAGASGGERPLVGGRRSATVEVRGCLPVRDAGMARGAQGWSTAVDDAVYEPRGCVYHRRVRGDKKCRRPFGR